MSFSIFCIWYILFFIMIWYYCKCFSWKIKISGRCLLSCPQSMVPIFHCLKIRLWQSERCQGKLLQLLPFQVCPSLCLITPELCGYIKWVKNLYMYHHSYLLNIGCYLLPRLSNIRTLDQTWEHVVKYTWLYLSFYAFWGMH